MVVVGLPKSSETREDGNLSESIKLKTRAEFDKAVLELQRVAEERAVFVELGESLIPSWHNQLYIAVLEYANEHGICLFAGGVLSGKTPNAEPVTECHDMVQHPPHYKQYPVEVIDIIRHVLGPEGFKAYCIGNELKYRLRAGDKGDAAQDMAKAMKCREFREGK